MFSQFFIERPVLSNVIALLMLLLGGIAIFQLPIAEYPEITPPTVQVTARYPGASATTLMKTVALPIEQQVNGVEKMLYMQSTSANDGTYTLTITFEVGTDLDFAQVLVQNRVSAALAKLPTPVQQQGVITKKKSTSFLQIISLISPDEKYDALFLSNYATLQLSEELQRIPGVGDVIIFGAGNYSMRIWLDPEQMLQRSLTPQDVMSTINAQNSEVAAGQIGAPPSANGQDFQYTVNVYGALNEVSQFEDIIVKSKNESGGELTRLSDIARIELGSDSYSRFFTTNGQPAAGIAIFQLPDANALDTAKAVTKTMERLAERFPEGVKYEIPFNTTIFEKESIKEVWVTLFQAGALVLIVIVVFLQDWRASLVPATTVPVTIVGAFAAMAALGFTINLLTLFAIVLAIGIVVDDAIVVVEGATQHMDRNKTPREAAILAMKDLFGPIIGVTLVLMSVFLPAAFLPGITGQMYRQFALVIAATAIISAINAVTLKPTQCALWLRPPKPDKKKNAFFRAFNAVYNPVENWYIGIIKHMVNRSGVMMIIGLLIIVGAGWGLTKVPTGFIPTEDQGYVTVIIQLPDGASLDRTRAVTENVSKIVRNTPGVASTQSIGGISAIDNNATLANAAIIYVVLDPWDERGKKEDIENMYDTLTKNLSTVQEANCRVLVPPPILGLGLSGGFQMEIQNIDSNLDFANLQNYTDSIVDQAMENDMIRLAFSTFRSEVPQYDIDINRDQAESLDVPVGDVFATLQTYLGSSYINLITKYGYTFPVFAQADVDFRMTPEALQNYYVRSNSGNMVPLGAVASIKSSDGPAIISLYDLYPSALINGIVNRGYSSGQAMELLEGIAKETLPEGMDYRWTQMSYQEQLVGSSTYIIFALAMILVYFMLAGQYESWITPFAVLLAVPMTLVGTVSVLLAVGIYNNIYVQIGLVLLISLSAKNAILIVAMARDRRREGMDLAEAAVEAARVRFRPIVMTSFTFMLGVLPLVLASGAGAMARKSLGIAVLSGMAASTCLAVLFVPAYYVVLQKFSEHQTSKKQSAS
ncbi:MAG: efflux RND transporter permease subunit [Verrucomicrobiota bacterium]